MVSSNGGTSTRQALRRRAAERGTSTTNKKRHLQTTKANSPKRVARTATPAVNIARLEKLPGSREAALPRTVNAQLATLVDKPPEGDQWLHEQKFDGYRMFCRIDGRDIRFISRNNQDWTGKFKPLIAAAARFKVKQAILDGEVVVLDRHGISSFQALQNAFREGKANETVYFVFDLLYLNGRDVTGLALEERKELLRQVLEKSAKKIEHIQLSEHLTGSGAKLLAKMCKLGLEGIVSKARRAPYVAGRTTAWQKSKCRQEQEFVIGGFTRPAGSRIGFGALLLGYYGADGKFIYAGRVGTGFKSHTLVEVLERLKPLAQKKSPFAEFHDRRGIREVVWVQPKLACQIAFNNWTDDNLLRQPVFLGFREDKPARDVKREAAI